MVRRWIIGVLSLLLAWQVLADGKAFPMVADPLADAASSTMPRQRAIIAWDGTEQRLAIDTAFTGEGTEFAWLVPLPSEPEISPATKGMFDTAAVLTATRIERSDSGGMLVVGAVLVLAAFGAMTLKSMIGRIVFSVAIVFFGVLVFTPAMGTPRGGSGPPMPVEVLSTGTAGIYDTAVLRAKDADELIAWLQAGGYGAPAGVSDVVQHYLDQGWVFAAAKLTVDDADAAEHRAHPLQFRFTTDMAVYPMALTAVGNEDIELELFVFANGSASGNGLRQACSLETKPDSREPDDTDARFMLRKRPVTIAHPGLVEIADGLGGLTRLVGTLTPVQQREDIAIEVTPFVEHDPGFYAPGTGIERGVGIGLIVAGALGLVLALISVDARQARDVLAKQQGRAIAIMAVAGIGVGAGVALATPVYRGEISSGREPLFAEQTLSGTGRFLAEFAGEQGAGDEAQVRALLPAMAPEEYWENIREGDGPLHYRLEPGDTDASLWFIWHDAIGGEHRSEIPLKVDIEADSG